MDHAQRRQVASALRATALVLSRKGSPGVRLDPRRSVTVDDRLIASLKSDLRKMTKLYKSIPTEDSPAARKQFWHVRGLFHAFHDRIQDLVFDQILRGQEEWESHRTLREMTGNFLASFKSGGWVRGSGQMFPVRWSSDGRPKEPIFHELARFRTQNIRRYQRDAREFFSWLEWWADLQGRLGKTATAPPVMETTNIAGFPVVIHKGDEQEWIKSWGKTYDESIKRVLPAIRHIANGMKKAGFGKALRSMTIHINLKDRNARDRAGEYDRGTDEVVIHPWGFTSVKDLERVLTHEVGHRFYYRNLNQKAIEHWEQVIKDKRARMSEEAVDAWVTEVIEPLYARNENYSGDDAIRETEKVLKGRDEVTQARYRHLAQNTSGGIKPSRMRSSMKNMHGSDPVLVEYVTDYGATKPEETFAEAFQLYITKGPRRLGPWTRQFFKEISRSGGAQVRSSMVRAKIQRPPRNLLAQFKILLKNAQGFARVLQDKRLQEEADYTLSLDIEGDTLYFLDKYIDELKVLLQEYQEILAEKEKEVGEHFPFKVVEQIAMRRFAQWSLARKGAVKMSEKTQKALAEVAENIERERDYLGDSPQLQKLDKMLPKVIRQLDFGVIENELKEWERLEVQDEVLPAHEDIETLYHASVNAADIARKGFAKEVPQVGGLGGSQYTDSGKRAISFTHDLHAAKEIARALKEVVMIAKGQYTAPQLVRHIKAEGTWDRLVTFLKNSDGERATADLLANLDKPHRLFWLYKKYLQQSPHRFDPIFFGAKIDDFKGANPRKVGVVVADVNMKHPDISFHAGEKEVRVPPDAVVKVKKLIR